MISYESQTGSTEIHDIFEGVPGFEVDANIAVPIPGEDNKNEVGPFDIHVFEAQHLA